MRIGIAGYGRMGSIIRETALQAGHEVPVIIDPTAVAPEITGRALTAATPAVDVIIDFTTPPAVEENIERYCACKVNAVIGTTGWYDRIEAVSARVEKAGTGLIWSGNFSPGVNIFFALVKEAGRIINRFPRYDAFIHEDHHRGKADSPSGTARMLGDLLLDSLDRKGTLVTETLQRHIEDHELHISSTRGGAVPGEHRVVFDSAEDTIILEHRARNRRGFAEGAVLAAEWIRGKRGFFHIDDMMKSMIGGGDD